MTWRLHRLTLIIRVSDSWSAATEAPSTEARGSVSQIEQIRLKLKTKLSKHGFILKYFDKWLKITSSRDTNQKYPLWKGDAFKVLMVCHFSIYRGSGEKSVRGKRKKSGEGNICSFQKYRMTNMTIWNRISNMRNTSNFVLLSKFQLPRAYGANSSGANPLISVEPLL